VADRARAKGQAGRKGSARKVTPAAPHPQAPNSLYERYKDALRRGHVAALRNRFDLAIDAYGEAASIAKDRALPHSAIGGILVRMGRPNDALAAYDRALALAPRDEASLRGRADVLAQMGERVEAAETLDRLADVLLASGRAPDSADAATRALELAESRERRRSLEALADKLRESPGDEAAEAALARVLHVVQPPVAPLPEPAVDTGAEPAEEPEPEAEPEPAVDPKEGIVLGDAAEESLHAGRSDEALSGLLAAAHAHRRVGRTVAAIDACYLALAVAPADADLHLLLAELYLERGWRTPAVDKLVLLGRLARLGEDEETRGRLCAIAAAELPGEPRLAELCA
jgi:tetratricopeptide (TPR) repeat protein